MWTGLYRHLRQQRCSGGTCGAKKRLTSEAIERLPRIKRRRTGTWGTVPWELYRFCDAWGVNGFSVYVAFNRLTSADVTRLMTTDGRALSVCESSASNHFVNPNS